ncbi:MAG: ribosome biogenesis GTPase Der, partial [Candidatus Goldbacteria bacterium]|nr:ribosome biogenesis GTPase Der [Candidatus Goldiibacteriota bacterium]
GHKAIVDDYPGVTRDMIECNVTWLGKSFKLIDTGGILYENPDKIKQLVLKQIEEILKKSDFVLFVVDAIAGLMPDDKKIYQYLKQSNKNFIVVVNKCDNDKLTNNANEFYELGVDKIFPVSAEHSIGLDSILDHIISLIPYKYTDKKEEEKKITRITITGRENVGKSSLFNAIIDEERMIVTDIPGTTRDAIDTEVVIKNKKYIFVDTAGIKKRKNINEKVLEYSIGRAFANIKRSDIIIHVIDVLDGILEIDKKILGYIHENYKGIILVINKWDIISPKERENLEEKYLDYIKKHLPFLDFMPVVFISALKKMNIEKLLDIVIKVENQYNHRVPTSSLNRAFNDIIYNKTVTGKSGHLRIYYMTQVKIAPPTFVIFTNRKEKLNDSYLRYIEGKIRDNFGFEGVSIKFKIKQKEK